MALKRAFGFQVQDIYDCALDFQARSVARVWRVRRSPVRSEASIDPKLESKGPAAGSQALHAQRRIAHNHALRHINDLNIYECIAIKPGCSQTYTEATCI